MELSTRILVAKVATANHNNGQTPTYPTFRAAREKVTGTFLPERPAANLRSMRGFAQKVPLTFFLILSRVPWRVHPA
jgi:hypothetical protein